MNKSKSFPFDDLNDRFQKQDEIKHIHEETSNLNSSHLIRWSNFIFFSDQSEFINAIVGDSKGTVFAINGINKFALIREEYEMPLSEIPKVLCLPSCEPEEAVHPTLEGKNLLNYEQILGQILSENSTSEKISILVEKSKLRLTIFQDLQAIKSYPIVLGGAPEGDKFREGDRRTPEGIYYVRDLYPHAAWSKFIWVDYPRPQSWREHFQAKFAGEIDWRSPIGGEIGIHGVPENGDRLIDEQNNWTLGCISLKNDDVDEIYQFIGHGTLIEILP